MRTRAKRWEKEARILSVEFTQKAKIMETPHFSDTPTIADSPLTCEHFRPPHPEDERVIRTLFGPNPDPEWVQDPSKDMPNIPLPEGYDPEAARRRIRAVGYRYLPPGAPVKETIRTEVEWADFLTDL
jgi:hypothetical protein